jgi:hypothetical protein
LWHKVQPYSPEALTRQTSNSCVVYFVWYQGDTDVTPRRCIYGILDGTRVLAVQYRLDDHSMAYTQLPVQLEKLFLGRIGRRPSAIFGQWKP